MNWVLLLVLKGSSSAGQEPGWQRRARDIFPPGEFGSALDPWVLLPGLVLLGALIGALWFRHWRSTLDQRPCPLLVFHQVAQDLGLSLSDEWVLYRLAARQALRGPLTLLVSQAALEHHAGAQAESLGLAWRAPFLSRIRAIERKVFGDGSVDEPGGGPQVVRAGTARPGGSDTRP